MRKPLSRSASEKTRNQPNIHSASLNDRLPDLFFRSDPIQDDGNIDAFDIVPFLERVFP